MNFAACGTYSLMTTRQCFGLHKPLNARSSGQAVDVLSMPCVIWGASSSLQASCAIKSWSISQPGHAMAPSCILLVQLPDQAEGLCASAWPKGLYAASLCHVGRQHFSGLRAGAMKALGHSRPGANPTLHLSLVEHPGHGPEYVATLASVLDLRYHGSYESVGHVLDWLSSEPRKVEPGPCRVMLDRIHRLGWAWEPSTGLMVDAIGPFSLWDIFCQELHYRVTSAWQCIVGAEIERQRRGFSGLSRADPVCTKRSYRQQPEDIRAALRCVLNGTLFTADATRHFDDQGSDRCRFCGQVDSVEHRFLHCQFFSEIREATGFSNLIREGLPHSQALHGWAQKAPTLVKFHRMLVDIPAVPCPALDLGGMDLFTDGSCLCPQNRVARIASMTGIGKAIQTAEVRPDSTAIGVRSACVWLRYPDMRLQRVEAWLAGNLKDGACRRHDPSWRTLPQPPFDSQMGGQ